MVRLDRAASWIGMFPWAGGFLDSALADPVEGLAQIHSAAWLPANLAMIKSPAFPPVSETDTCSRFILLVPLALYLSTESRNI